MLGEQTAYEEIEYTDVSQNYFNNKFKLAMSIARKILREAPDEIKATVYDTYRHVNIRDQNFSIGTTPSGIAFVTSEHPGLGSSETKIQNSKVREVFQVDLNGNEINHHRFHFLPDGLTVEIHSIGNDSSETTTQPIQIVEETHRTALEIAKN